MENRLQADGVDRKWLRHDVIAALTVSAIAVPQAMAYAQIAGLPPQYGLYTGFVVTALGSLFGSSSHLDKRSDQRHFARRLQRPRRTRQRRHRHRAATSGVPFGLRDHPGSLSARVPGRRDPGPDRSLQARRSDALCVRIGAAGLHGGSRSPDRRGSTPQPARPDPPGRRQSVGTATPVADPARGWADRFAVGVAGPGDAARAAAAASVQAPSHGAIPRSAAGPGAGDRGGAVHRLASQGSDARCGTRSAGPAHSAGVAARLDTAVKRQRRGHRRAGTAGSGGRRQVDRRAHTRAAARTSTASASARGWPISAARSFSACPAPAR